MGNITRPKGELRKMARLAKERMKNGYWAEARNVREPARLEAETSGKSVNNVNNYYRRKFSDDLMVKVAPQDDTLYLKVCEILESDDDISNPIAVLIEQDKYNILDNSGKQRYIMMLSAKYRELSERYYREQEIRKEIT